MPRSRKWPPNRAATVAPFSENRKTGPVAVTYTAQNTCPPSCPLKRKGCYAESGPGGMVTARLNRGAAGKSALEVVRDEAALIAALPAVADLRLHAVGDAPTDECARVLATVATHYLERGANSSEGGVRVWTYTHAWKTVARESWGPVSVLASCHSPEEVAQAASRGYAACTIVAEWEDCEHYTEYTHSSQPLKAVPCPYQTKGTQCVKCRLCMDDGSLLEKGIVIAFRAHGTKRASVLKSLPVLGGNDE